MLDVSVVCKAVLEHDFGFFRFFDRGVSLSDWLLDLRNVRLGSWQTNRILVDVLDWELLQYPSFELMSDLCMATLLA